MRAALPERIIQHVPGLPASHPSRCTPEEKAAEMRLWTVSRGGDPREDQHRRFDQPRAAGCLRAMHPHRGRNGEGVLVITGEVQEA